MQLIRYANVFNRVTRIRSNHCFPYNNAIVFAVPRVLVVKAIGLDNKNLKILSEILKRKIKIVAIPNGKDDIENFVSVITNPVRFKGIEIRNGEAIISASPQSRASLIGRGKIRLEEMQDILEQYFGIKKLRIK